VILAGGKAYPVFLTWLVYHKIYTEKREMEKPETMGCTSSQPPTMDKCMKKLFLLNFIKYFQFAKSNSLI